MSNNCIICLVCIGKMCNQIYGCFIGRISIVNELYYLYCSDIAPSGSLSLASTQTLLDAAFLLMMMLVSLLPVLMMMMTWMTMMEITVMKVMSMMMKVMIDTILNIIGVRQNVRNVSKV